MGIYRGPQIITDSLLYSFDAASYRCYPRSGYTMTDLSGNKRNGYVRGTVTWGSTYGGYFETGESQITNYIELPESAPQALTSGVIYTIEWWCTMKSTSTGRYQQSFVNSAGGNLFIIGKDASSFSVYSNTLVSGTAPTYTVDVPQQLVITSDGSYTYFYKNGVLTSTWSAAWGDLKTTAGYIIDQEQDAAKGAFDANQNTYGWWHATRLYNRVLTASEILSNYNTLKRRFGLN